MSRTFLITLLLALLWPSASRARGFDLRRDAFAFANDTVLQYGVDEAGQLHIRRRDQQADFSHRCFVLARAVIQFQKFARFAPESPRVSREEFRRRVKRICRIPVWAAGPARPIEIPGYPDLHSFSIAYEGLLKENLGNWVPSYLRLGNWRMAMPHPRAGQAAGARWLNDSMTRGQLRAVYLTRFPKMNHVVVVYRARPEAGGNVRYSVYDPNYPNAPGWLLYRASEQSFEFQKRWYFPGGRVNLMRVFISPLH